MWIGPLCGKLGDHAERLAYFEGKFSYFVGKLGYNGGRLGICKGRFCNYAEKAHKEVRDPLSSPPKNTDLSKFFSCQFLCASCIVSQ